MIFYDFSTIFYEFSKFAAKISKRSSVALFIRVYNFPKRPLDLVELLHDVPHVNWEQRMHSRSLILARGGHAGYREVVGKH